MDEIGERILSTFADIGGDGVTRRAANDAGDRLAADVSLMGGPAGWAIFWTYLARINDDHAHAAAADSALDRAVRSLPRIDPGWSLFGGISGLAWAAEHLRRPGEADPNGDVDQVLQRALSRTSSAGSGAAWPGGHDLVSGLVGVGVYALERYPAGESAAILARVVELLAQTCQRTRDGITWASPARPLARSGRSPSSAGRPDRPGARVVYDLGVAHGVPGVIAFLGQASRLEEPGVAEPAQELLTGAVDWLLACRLSPLSSAAASVVFPSFSGTGIEAHPARSAWCYGDPGIAAALLSAADAVDNPTWAEVAADIASTAARRPVGEAGVVDAGLCHGAAGLGYVFNRLYQATGRAEIGEAARYWLEHTLRLWTTGRAGQAVAATDCGRDSAGTDLSLLDGAAGIGLALLAGTSTVEPAWDRVLLISPLRAWTSGRPR